MKRSLVPLLLFCILLTMSCRPKIGAGSVPTTTNVQVLNPMYAVPVGPLGGQNQDNYPDLKIKIIVQTMDANNNAVVYKNYTDTYRCDRGNQNQTLSFTKKVEVPKSGSFVIQVFVEGLECVVAQSGCVQSSTSGKLEYFSQQTLSQGVPGMVVFSVASLAKINVECC